MSYIASFSGGKDSTAMVLRLIEEGWPLDEIVMFDTGWEFPEMYEHIARFEGFTGRKVTVLYPKKSFQHWLLKQEVVGRKGTHKGRVHRIGYGWPSPMRRWCTDRKVRSIDRHCKDAVRYIGIAADEAKRTESKTLKKLQIRYPLIEWDMDEAACLAYCRERGFDWSGLYDIFARVSCFCCPLQRIGELRNLRRHCPDLWAKMLEWDAQMGPHNRGFKGYDTVHDLEQRFANEDCQMHMWRR